MTSSVKGLAELDRKLNKLSAEMAAKSLRQSTGIAAQAIVDEARVRIPEGSQGHVTYKGRWVEGGFAKQSIAKRTRLEDGVAIAQVGVRQEAFYAVQFVELGTTKMSPRPWLVPALEAAQDKSIDRLKTALERKIKKLAK